MTPQKFERSPSFQRRTYQGNWRCSECGKEITELPFEPSADRPIYCRDCWAKKSPRNSNAKV